MNQVLLPNLFFEEELLASATARSPKAKRVVADLGPVMGLVSGDGIASRLFGRCSNLQRTIVIVDDFNRPNDLPHALRGVEYLTVAEVAKIVAEARVLDSQDTDPWEAIAWGWSESAVHTLRNAGLQVETPDPAVVRTINSRQFQAQFDVAIDSGGVERIESFGTLCRTMPKVITAVQAGYAFAGLGWVIKADLSHAARNRLRGTSPILTASHLAWLELRFSLGEYVYVEPWVERLVECGLQFHVRQSEDGAPDVEFAGESQMLTDKAGRYLGSFVQRRSGDLWDRAIDHGHRIAESAAKLGYIGLLGIDCMLFCHPQTRAITLLRLSHDINGRHTMGRLALSLKKFAEPEETVVWIHAPANRTENERDESDRYLANGVRIIPTSPGLIADAPPETRTLLVASKDIEQVRAACCEILRQDV